MEVCSIDISAVANRLNLLCCAAGREIMGRNAGGDGVLCCRGSNKLFYPFLSKTKGRYK
jgi:hypothetical protein